MLNTILDHVDEPFDRRCLLDHDDSPHHFAPEPQLFKPLVADVKRWEDHLDPAGARRIEDRLAHQMALLGYPRHTR